jgi:hypothetical protein
MPGEPGQYFESSDWQFVGVGQAVDLDLSLIPISASRQ